MVSKKEMSLVDRLGRLVKSSVAHAKELTLHFYAHLEVHEQRMAWLCLTLGWGQFIYAFDAISLWAWAENEFVEQSLEAS